MRVTWLALEWPREGHHAGGVGRYLTRLAKEMASIIDLTVVAFEGALPHDGVRLVTIPAPRRRFDRYYIAPWRAIPAVADTWPAVYHSHGDDLGWSPDGIPLVRTFYGSSWNEAKSSSGLRRLNHAVLAATEGYTRRRADLRLAIAPETVGMFDCQYLVPPYLRSSLMGPDRIQSVASRVVFIGSHGGRKRGHLAESALAELRDEFPSLSLTVIGPASDAPNWAPWVDHRAGLDDYEVSSLLASASVLISPSQYEGFGIPVLEALEHGVRVVATPNPGSEYLMGLAGPHCPLVLANASRLGEAVRAAIVAGPLLRPEIEAAHQLVWKMAAAGSAERMLHIYEDAIGRLSRR